MGKTVEMTYAKFTAEMIEFAKEHQGVNYPGDEYYTQYSWKEYWEDGNSPYDAVISDMSY